MVLCLDLNCIPTNCYAGIGAGSCIREKARHTPGVWREYTGVEQSMYDVEPDDVRVEHKLLGYVY